jgi:hypothetical protein
MSPKWPSNISNPFGATPPKARVELYAEKQKFLFGEVVKGKIKLTSDEEFVVDQVYVRLSCDESIRKIRTWSNRYWTHQQDYWDQESLYADSCKLFGASKVPQGFSQWYNYAINITFAAPETLHTIDHNIRWILHAVIESNDRPRVQSQDYEVQVKRPQILVDAPALEVTREVVLIPCAYCGGLMPQTSVFCPNCGVRRKR